MCEYVQLPPGWLQRQIAETRAEVATWPPGWRGTHVPWTESWPRYRQACFSTYAKACDVIVGACCCGATHGKGEFTFRSGVLRRYGVIVPVERGQGCGSNV